MQTIVRDGFTSTTLMENAMGISRRTGAEAGYLTDISSHAARYGQAGFLEKGYSGLIGSGMKHGQYSEYLSAMRSILDEGLGLGVRRTADDINSGLNMFSRLGNGQAMWQGERGAALVSKMNSSMYGAKGLTSVGDALSYQTASDITAGMSAAEFKKKYGVYKTGTYQDAMIALEHGTTPEFLQGLLKKLEVAENGSESAIIERLVRQGFSTTQATHIWQNRGAIKGGAGVADVAMPEMPKGDEYKTAIAVEQIKNMMSKQGMDKTNDRLEKIIEKLTEMGGLFKAAAGGIGYKTDNWDGKGGITINLPPGY